MDIKKKYKSLFLLLLLVFSKPVWAQVVIQWEKSFGGSNYEYGNAIFQTADKGYIIAGAASSSDGDVTINIGGVYDFWVIKLDSTGTVEWEKSYGGPGTGGVGQDRATSVVQTTDLGYIITGSSNSTSGDVTGNHGSYDYWVIKISSSGNLVWQKSLGGTGSDYPTSIIQSSDGNYVVAGYTSSTDGDVTGNHGGWDYWVVKLNTSGTIIWQKCLGGTDADWAMQSNIQVIQTTDGGYMVAGDSRSTNGDVTGNHGWMDYWVVKLNSSGNIQWQNSYGGSRFDHGASVTQTKDKGYIITGSSQSNDGDVTGHHGEITLYDYWVVKTDSLGVIQWQKSLGGAMNDFSTWIVQTADSGYMVAGYTYSGDANVTNNNGYTDYWLVKLNSTGNIQWQKTLGGIQDDYSYGVIQTIDGGYAAIGHTFSNNSGDVSSNHGTSDYWIVKLCNLIAPVITPNGSTAFCQGGSVTLDAGAGYNTYVWSTGASTQTINANQSGIYSVEVANANGCSATAVITVTVHTLPQLPSVSANGTTSFCEGDSVTLFAEFGYTSYLWSDGNTTSSVIVSQTGVYTVTVSDSYGCTTGSSPISVSVFPLPPVPVISQNGNALISSAVSGIQWYLNGNLISGAISQVYQPVVSGLYTVLITDSNGCSSMSSAYNFITTGIDNYTDASRSRPFPNPFNDFTVILLNAIPLSFEVTDLTGRNIIEHISFEIQKIVSQFRLVIYQKDLSEGIYLYKIDMDNGKQATGTLLIQQQ